jgi:branched-chain amino acid transport system substrate-binding protein
MSQKNETAVLFLAFLITVGLVGGGAWLLKDNIWPQKSQDGGNVLQPNNKLITDRISFGEKTLSPIVGLKQKLSPNIAQTRYISGKYVTIMG